jgi:hypothetical protein
MLCGPDGVALTFVGAGYDGADTFTWVALPSGVHVAVPPSSLTHIVALWDPMEANVRVVVTVNLHAVGVAVTESGPIIEPSAVTLTL